MNHHDRDSHATVRDAEPASLRRVAVASCAGTTIEFYDFFIYGTAAALVFPTVFFPALGSTAGTVASFATYAVAFLARPLGAVAFGHFGDRLGRKRTLISTLVLMGAATVLIGLLPSAATIGVAAPVLLVVLRLAQGLAVGGEWAGATLLAAENAPSGRRGAYAVFPQLGPASAFALSSATFLAVNLFVGEASNAFVTYGWRIPFLASTLLVAIGLYVRLNLEETPVFREAAAQDRPRTAPLLDVVRNQPLELVLAGLSTTMLFAFFYIGTAYLTSYGTAVLGLSRATVLSLGIVAAAVCAAGVVVSGRLSDRVGRRSIVIGACVMSVPWGLALFPLLDQGSTAAFALGLSGTLLVMGLAYGPAGALLPELFRTEYRYTGAGMAYALAAVLGGATAPIIAAQLAGSGDSDKIGWVLAGFGVVSLLATLLMPETRDRAIRPRPAD